MSMEKIKSLKKAGFFGSLDVQMADLVSRIQPGAKEDVLMASALANRAINQGHACVDLAAYAGRSWSDIMKASLPVSQDGEELTAEEQQAPGKDQEDCGALPSIEAWKESLKASVVGDGSEIQARRTLLVLKDSRLYLRRYWDYEHKVEEALKRLNVASGITAEEEKLERYFRDPGSDEQKQAARKAVESRLSLLSGGPGTGKTYTLARAVALLAEMNQQSGKTPAVRLVAPTGKAAVRVVESIKKAKQELATAGIDKALVDAIPEQATTIHRLLESRYQSPYFKHDASKPLAADMVIVDEASMVDLPLMAKLLDALPAQCTLMLVGDIDQLASVEPGRVYGDVCRAAEKGRPLGGCLSRLTQSRRFPHTSAIGKISQLINDGYDADAWNELQKDRRSQHLRMLDALELENENSEFRKLVQDRMDEFLTAKVPKDALAAANQFRILCALRKGPYGVKRINRLVEKILSEKGLEPSGRFYDHQLIMIRVNTPALNLFNGDVGVVLAREGQDKKKEYLSWFPDAEQGAKSIPVSLLPDHETAFAMTVHKSQGSEFPYVALLLPEDANSPILTRELLYTGMTRVQINEKERSGQLVMWCSEASFKKAVRTRTLRETGLFACEMEGVGTNRFNGPRPGVAL